MRGERDSGRGVMWIFCNVRVKNETTDDRHCAYHLLRNSIRLFISSALRVEQSLIRRRILSPILKVCISPPHRIAGQFGLDAGGLFILADDVSINFLAIGIIISEGCVDLGEGQMTVF